jgi:hypothetical protein
MSLYDSSPYRRRFGHRSSLDSLPDDERRRLAELISDLAGEKEKNSRLLDSLRDRDSQIEELRRENSELIEKNKENEIRFKKCLILIKNLKAGNRPIGRTESPPNEGLLQRYLRIRDGERPAPAPQVEEEWLDLATSLNSNDKLRSALNRGREDGEFEKIEDISKLLKNKNRIR